MIKKDSNTSEQQRDPELKNIEIALKRAALKARELAKKNGTAIVYMKDGEIHKEYVT